MYLPKTSESSARDSPNESSVRLSCKRCRSPAATVISSIHATRALVPFCVDLLPPRKRFRDSISPEDSVKEDIDTDVLEDIEADDTVVEVTVDTDVEAGIDACIGMEVDVGIDVEDEVESSDRASRSSSLTTSTSEIPTAPILPAPSAIITPSSEFPLAPVAWTVRKSVRPLPSHRLELRYTLHHLDHFTSESSSSHSSSDHSSSGHSSSGHSLSKHTPPETTDADSSTSPRFVYPSLAKA
nr:hypothetical protein [Tanacetum cinerariifolium]